MRLRREEWILGLVVLLLLVILNGLLIAKYDALFSVVCDDYSKLLSPAVTTLSHVVALWT